MKIIEAQVKQVGNLTENANRDNPQRRRVYDTAGISPTLCEQMGTGGNLQPFIVASRGRNPQNPSDRTTGAEMEQRLEPNSEGICNTLTSVQKDNYVLEPLKIEYRNCTDKLGKEPVIFEMRTDELRMFEDNICGTLRTIQEGGNKGVIESSYRIRKLTPKECWRLMDFTDLDFFSAMLLDRQAAIRLMIKYKDNLNGIEIMREAETMQKMSNTQLYKQAGNSIVKAVLMGIFKQLY